MYIIPYVLELPAESKSDFKVWTAWVFLQDGGQKVWYADETSIEEIKREYLEPNNFIGEICVKGDCVLVKIDPVKTKLSDFYIWTEFLARGEQIPKCDLWRPFVWIGELNPGVSDDWEWNEECKKLPLGQFGSLFRFWSLLV